MGAILWALATLLACASQREASSANQPSPASANSKSLSGEDDGQWPLAGRDYANTRFSRLTQVNSGNVNQLKLAWTFSTGRLRGHEAAPLIVNNTLYLVTPFPNYLYALDLTKPGAPMKWKYDPQPQPAAQGVACCDQVNRGAAYANGRVFYNTLDNHTVAVDANTGQQIWKTKVGEINQGETMTMAPLVVKNKVLVGNSGGEFGVRGWLTALDANTGQIAWRAYSTGPDADCLIGPNFKPHYAHDQGRDLGVSSWPPDQWKIGGGTVWGFLSYDPEQNLIFYGTANPGPWNPEQRPGDNKWTCGVFARNPDDGQARWFYQWNPHDLYDWDGINENVLVDLTINGQPRKTLLHADRNGFLYVLDRTTGAVISAARFAFTNTISGIDPQSGRPNYVAEKKPQTGKVVRNICPTAPGAKDWQPAAWSPQTGLLYIPHQNICMDDEVVQASYIAGTPYVGANVKMYAGPGGHRGEVTAWNPAEGKAAWKIKESFPVWSGALATAGEVVFYGTLEGWFKAIHARTGEPLWQFKCGSGIVGQPVSYRGPDGKQYIAVLSGVGGWAGAVVACDLDSRDASAAKGFANVTSDLPQHTTKGGMLYVFALP
jgi:lanthanide-dependent methanol dehydrogenase